MNGVIGLIADSPARAARASDVSVPASADVAGQAFGSAESLAKVASRLDAPVEAVAATIAGVAWTRVFDRDAAAIAIRSTDGAASCRLLGFSSNPDRSLRDAILGVAAELARPDAPSAADPADAVVSAAQNTFGLSFPGDLSSLETRALREAFELLADDALASLPSPISQLRVLPPERVEALLALGRGEIRPPPATATLIALIAEWVLRTPDAVAVEDAETGLTYRDLMARVDALAGILGWMGVRRGQIVAVRLRRSVTLAVALLAIQRVGAAFLPLDSSHPTERTAFMLDDAEATLVLADEPFETKVRVLRLDGPLPIVTGTAALEPARPDDLAYVLYTSGSTGRPKAVSVEQRNIANLALWGAARFGAEACRGIVFSAALVFDLAMFELFSPLVSGGRVLIVDNPTALGRSPLRDKARVFSMSPTVLDEIVRRDGLPERLTCLVSAGERLTRPFADRILAARPDLRLFNGYGPTETTVYATFAEILAGEPGAPPIGRAIANVELRVVDRAGRLAPEGVEGELCISGAGVSRGYLNRPELTGERFLPDPFGSGRLYRSGDRVRWRPDGQLDYLGRADGQVKIHGVRIELGEVEAALTRLPEVAAAAVGVRGEDESRALVAWIVPAGAPGDATALRRGLAALLPIELIPKAFVFLTRLPVTTNGKLDHAALPAPESHARASAPRRPPGTANERAVFALWRETIDLPAVRDGDFGVDDDLFDLGADSLALVRLNMEIEARFGTRVAGGLIDGGMTVAKLAALITRSGTPGALSRSASPAIEAQVDARDSTFLVRVRPARGQSRGAVVGMPYGKGNAGLIGVIAANALYDYDIWAFAVETGGRQLMQDDVGPACAEAMAARLLAEGSLRPKAFVGFSFGGFLGWLVDRLLVAAGRPATPLINFDGGALHLNHQGWRERVEAAIEKSSLDQPSRMLLLHCAALTGGSTSTKNEQDWRSAGVVLESVGFPTIVHDDLNKPEIFRASREAMAGFVETSRVHPRLLPNALEINTVGGRLFRTLNDPGQRTVEAVRTALKDEGIPDDGPCRDALWSFAERTLDFELARELAERLTAADPRSQSRLAAILLRGSDRDS